FCSCSCAKNKIATNGSTTCSIRRSRHSTPSWSCKLSPPERIKPSSIPVISYHDVTLPRKVIRGFFLRAFFVSSVGQFAAFQIAAVWGPGGESVDSRATLERIFRLQARCLDRQQLAHLLPIAKVERLGTRPVLLTGKHV